MSGRPKGSKTIFKYHARKSYKVAGRYKERLKNLQIKREKLATLESLIFTHERQTKPNHDEIRDLKRRANELRTQLAVTSTVEPLTKENITR